MGKQAPKHVMRVLPHSFGDDQRGVGINLGEDIQTFPL